MRFSPSNIDDCKYTTESIYQQYVVRCAEIAEGGPGVHDYYAKRIISEIQKVVDGEQTLEDFEKNTPHIKPRTGRTLNYIRDRIIDHYPN